MFREVVPPGPTFRRAYIPGTDDPQPQTGLLGNQYLLNTSTNEETEDHNLFSSEISSTWPLLPTNPPPLTGGLAEVGPHEGPTRYPPFSPATALNPNIPIQYPITNTQQLLTNSHGSALTAPSPASADVPYSLHPYPLHPYPLHPYPLQSPPGAPYRSSNVYQSPSFPIASYSTGHSQDGPPISDYEWNTFLQTGLVPNTPQERVPWSPQTTLHDGSPVSTSSMNPPRTGHTDSASYKHITPRLDQGATNPATLALGHASEPASPTPFSPGHNYAEVQNPIVNNGAVYYPKYRQLIGRPVATESGETQIHMSGLGPPAATVDLPEGRGTSSSTSLQPASQSGDRDEEIRQAWIDLEHYCLCEDRTKKPLRHWEDQCPYNLNKRPRLYCDLPGCRNKDGFPSVFNLRRHKENASYHKGQK